MKWLIVGLVLFSWLAWFCFVIPCGMAAAHEARSYRQFLEKLVRATWQLIPIDILLEWALREDLATAVVASMIRYAVFLAACHAGAMIAIVTSNREERKRWFDHHRQGESDE